MAYTRILLLALMAILLVGSNKAESPAPQSPASAPTKPPAVSPSPASFEPPPPSSSPAPATPPSSISDPPSEAPGPAENSAILNSFSLAGYVAVGLLAIVCVV